MVPGTNWQEHLAAADFQRLWRSHLESAAAYLLKDDLQDKPVVELSA